MDNPPDDEHSRSRESEDSTFLFTEIFRGHTLTRTKKLRSPVRSNESSAAMPTPIPALVVYDLDDETPSYEHHEHYEDENDADDDKSENDEEEDEGEVSDSGSSTPKASRQSFGLTSPPPAYVTTTERPTIPRASRQMEGQGEGAYGSSPTLLPARAYSPPGENRWRRRQGHGHGHGHGRNESVSSMATIKPAKSEQEVLDAMISDLSRTLREDDDADHGVYERGLGLKPARSLRRERRQGRD